MGGGPKVGEDLLVPGSTMPRSPFPPSLSSLYYLPPFASPLPLHSSESVPSCVHSSITPASRSNPNISQAHAGI